MTFPTYSPGDLGPSAWANLVGEFHDDRFLGISLGGGLGAAAWQTIGWSVVEDPNGYLVGGNTVVLPSPNLYLAVFSLEYSLTATNVDHLRMRAYEGTNQRLRSDNEVSIPVSSWSGVLAGLIQGYGTAYTFDAYTNIGGTVPVGGSTSLSIVRIGA